MKHATKLHLKDALLALGDSGFGGTLVVSDSARDALVQVLSPAMSDVADVDKLRIYRLLTRQGYVQIDHEDTTHIRVTLTPAGAYRLQDEIIRSLEVPRMATWDGIWRVVCYDIPAQKTKDRHILTHHLRRMGFAMIQKSMWVHPYECMEIIKKITDTLNLTRYVSVLEVSKFDEVTSGRLKRIFDSYL